MHAEINASCRGPALVLFFCAVTWLVFGSILSCIASLKFHMPGLLADAAWLTYGRLHAAAVNAFLYGFAMQAALAVALWLVARLGRTRLVQPGLVTVAALFWNAGVKLGVFGILIGDSTAYEWLEMPRYAAPVLFFSYAVIGVCALLTFSRRNEPELYVSQWFLLAAFFWFPWIYATANLLLVFAPARGMFQMVVNGWYVGNLATIWFGFIGLAALFYFIPQLAGRPLHSRYQAMFTFWTLALFGGWGSIPHSAPVPSWIPSLCTVFAVFTILPVVAAGLNLWRTFAEASSERKQSVTLRLFVLAGAAYVLAGILNGVTALDRVNEIVHFTLFVPALKQLFLYGFVAFIVFGAIYELVPRLLGAEFPSAGLIRIQVGCAVIGLALYVFPLAIGGVVQGVALNNPGVPFMESLKSALLFFRMSTPGDLLFAAGHVALLLNFARLFVRECRTCCVPAMVAAVRPETAEVAR